MKVRDIERMIDAFNADRDTCNRYASFDYCYSYFHPKNRHLHKDDTDRGALELGFYLASWGMFRGSSFLLAKSYKHFTPLVRYIYSCPDLLWKVDCQCYDEQNIDLLLENYRLIRELLIHDNNSHVTLVTKVMLGVFANVPAYDRFFINTFSSIYRGRSSFTSFNKPSLRCIADFYQDNRETIERMQKKSFVLKPEPKHRKLNYTRAKIIDMYGFARGIRSGD